MVRNQIDLLVLAPIVGMASTKERLHGVSHGLSEAGYDIRIKQTVRFKCLLWLLPFHKVGDDRWRFGKFTLASAVEQFNMPPNLVGIVHDKSTWARRTLSVFNTVIEPGWKGYLTLELVYHGNDDLIIPAGTGIAQVIFHEVSLPAAYEGKYQNQEDNPVAARDS